MDFIYDPSLVLYLPLYKLDGNSFMSKDQYGHLCTVTGAKWGLEGRSFGDGNSDNIDLGNPTALQVTSAWTFITWFKCSANAVNKGLLTKSDGTNDSYRFILTGSGTIQISHWISGVQKYFGSDAAYDDDNWHCAIFENDGTDLILEVDGTTKSDATKGGTTDNDPADVYLGNWRLSNESLNGILREVIGYSRALSYVERRYIYQATKERYR